MDLTNGKHIVGKEDNVVTNSEDEDVNFKESGGFAKLLAPKVPWDNSPPDRHVDRKLKLPQAANKTK